MPTYTLVPEEHEYNAAKRLASDFESRPRRRVRFVFPIVERRPRGITMRTADPPSLDLRTCVINRIV